MSGSVFVKMTASTCQMTLLTHILTGWFTIVKLSYILSTVFVRAPYHWMSLVRGLVTAMFSVYVTTLKWVRVQLIRAQLASGAPGQVPAYTVTLPQLTMLASSILSLTYAVNIIEKLVTTCDWLNRLCSTEHYSLCLSLTHSLWLGTGLYNKLSWLSHNNSGRMVVWRQLSEATNILTLLSLCAGHNTMQY